MKRLAWFSAALAAFLWAGLGFGQVGGPMVGQAQLQTTVLCKTFAPASAPADTTEDALATCNVPANFLGANGLLRITTFWTFTSSTNGKTLRIRYSGASGTAYYGNTYSSAGIAPLAVVTVIANQNATGTQAGFTLGGTTAGGVVFANGSGAVDTTPATSVVASCQKVSGAETCTLTGIIVEAMTP